MVADPCYIEEGVEITAEASSDESYTIRPQTRKAGVNVVVYDSLKEPIPATVYVDNQLLGTAPLRTAVPLCAKTVKVEYEGKSASQSLTLREHQIKDLVVEVH